MAMQSAESTAENGLSFTVIRFIDCGNNISDWKVRSRKSQLRSKTPAWVCTTKHVRQ